MAANQNVQNFEFETEARSLQLVSSSIESFPAIQETWDMISAPCLRLRDTTTGEAAAQMNMRSAVEMLRQLESNLRPVYDSFRHQRFEERSTLLEQQDKISDACETILAIIKTVEVIETKISDQPPAPVDLEFNSQQPASDNIEVRRYVRTHVVMHACVLTTSATIY